jgi:hypothetical protein
MPSLVGGYTEIVYGKFKSGNRFLKPNFERGPSPRFGKPSDEEKPSKCTFRAVSVGLGFLRS